MTDWQTQFGSPSVHGRRAVFFAAARGTGWLAINASNLMACRNKGIQNGYGKIRCSHEDDAHVFLKF
jgi:hypothetical protein